MVSSCATVAIGEVNANEDKESNRILTELHESVERIELKNKTITASSRLSNRLLRDIGSQAENQIEELQLSNHEINDKIDRNQSTLSSDLNEMSYNISEQKKSLEELGPKLDNGVQKISSQFYRTEESALSIATTLSKKVVSTNKPTLKNIVIALIGGFLLFSVITAVLAFTLFDTQDLKSVFIMANERLLLIFK